MKTETLIHELSQNLAPVRPLHHPLRRYIYWLCFACSFVVLGAFWIGVRVDLEMVLFNSDFILQTALLLLLFLTTSLAALFLGAPDIKSRQYTLLSGTVLVCVLFLFISSLLVETDIHPGTGWNCIRNILLLCLPPAGLSYYLLSKAYPLKKNFAGLFSLLGASSLACLATRFICPNDDLMHFFVWHYVPALVVGGIGFSIGHLVFAKAINANSQSNF